MRSDGPHRGASDYHSRVEPDGKWLGFNRNLRLCRGVDLTFVRYDTKRFLF